MLLLLVLLGFVLLRWFLSRRRHAGPTPAMAGAHGGSGPEVVRLQPAAAAAPQAGAYGSPALSNAVAQGLDTAAVAEAARAIFLRLQQANDAADLDTLRRYSTPEMAEAAQRDLQVRGHAPQRTDVVKLDAKLVDMAREGGQDIASVRFSGLLREEDGGVAEPFDELWHLVRPGSGHGEWRLAGIQPIA
jgi:predicted lipid-binding transport protein (Tim44 family)